MTTRLDQLFVVEYGHKLDLNKMRPVPRGEGVAFIGRRGGGQGVADWVEQIQGLPPAGAGLLTVALGGSLLSSFVQQAPFYTAQNVAVLTPIDRRMPLKHRLFYAMCIHHNAFRYTTFGREANRTLSTIRVPDAVPEWVDETPLPTHDGLARTALDPRALSDITKWGTFSLGELFRICKGSRVKKADRSPGETRFIGASDKNNGVTDHSDIQANFCGGSLTVAYNGSVGSTFYQDEPFFACDDVNVLTPKDQVSKWALLFVAAVISLQRSRYTYGYKWTLSRMISTKIRLPCLDEGQPDWEYMECFMKGLPFSAAVPDIN